RPFPPDMTAAPPPLHPLLYEATVRRALREDLGRAGDLTTDAIVPPAARVAASIAARRPGRIAGLDVAAAAFRLLDPAVKVELHARDGDDVVAAATLARVTGPARAILSAERVALNFLGRLSGVATATREAVAAA